MARVELAPGVGDDLDRIVDRRAEYDPDHAAARVGVITQALDVLESNPAIGRPSAADKRELVIGRGSRGCVTPYRYVPELDVAFVLVVRSQREAGYPRG